MRLVLNESSLRVVEGGTASFYVSLTGHLWPGGSGDSLTVTVERTDGDVDLTVREGASFTFGPGNWDAREVVLAAAKDADNEDGTATFTVSAPGLEPVTLVVTEADQDPLAPVFTTVPVTRAAVDAPYRLTVRARGRPEPTYALRTAPEGMSLDALGNLTWMPSQVGEVDVAVVASNGLQPDAELSFRLVVGADQFPSVRILAPLDGERVPSGWADYACECTDDLGCARATFLLDGALLETQEGPGPIYSVGGAPGRWNTTGLATGPHFLQVLVTDTTGHQGLTAAIDVCIACAEPDAGTAVDGGGFVFQEGDDIIEGCGCGTGAMAPAAWVGLGLLGLRARRRRA